ncbi:glycoside hydrolase family 16 protein [Kitasatospora sp. P5_F3]
MPQIELPTGRRAASAVAAALLTLPFSGVAAAAPPVVEQVRLTAPPMTAGLARSASLTVRSRVCVPARRVGVAVRSASGANLDFPGGARNVRICSGGLTVTTEARALPAGSYRVFGFWQDPGGGWHNLPEQTLTVAASGEPTWSDGFDGVTVPLGSWDGCVGAPVVRDRHCTGLPAALDANWWAYPQGWADTSGLGSYSPARTLSVADGRMTIRLSRDDTGTWVAAPTPKLPGASPAGGVRYGRFEITWRADHAAGFKLAWLLWPDSELWSRDGEIDFPEGDLNGNVSAFMHRRGSTSDTDQDGYPTDVPMAGAWHTTVIDWQPDSLSFYLDGTLLGTSTTGVPDTPMHWVLQSETSATGPAGGTTAEITVDAVRYWKAG